MRDLIRLPSIHLPPPQHPSLRVLWWKRILLSPLPFLHQAEAAVWCACLELTGASWQKHRIPRYVGVIAKDPPGETPGSTAGEDAGRYGEARTPAAT